MSDLTSFFGLDSRKNARRTGEDIARVTGQQRQVGTGVQDQGLDVLEQVMPWLMSSYLNYSADPGSSQSFMSSLFDNYGANDVAYDNAVAATEQDLAGANIAPGSMMHSAAVSGIRADQASDIGNSRRQLIAQEVARREAEKQRRLESLYGFGNNMFGTGTNMINNTVGQMGGLQNMYNTDAANAIGNITSIAGLLTGPGGLGKALTSWIPGMRSPQDAGNNGMSTNQSPSPVPSTQPSMQPVPYNPGGMAGMVAYGNNNPSYYQMKPYGYK